MSGLRWLAGGAAAVVAAPLSIVLLLSPPTGEASCGGDGPIVDVPAHQFSQQEMTDLWVASGGSRASTRVSGVGDVPDPVIAGAVGMAESGGDPGIVNRIGAGGLMQVHPPEPNYLDPGTNMHIAVGKWREAKARGGTGWEPWEAFTGPDARGDDGPFRRRLPDVLGGATGGAGTIAPADCGGDLGDGSKLGPVSGDWLASVPGMPGEQCDRRIVPDVEALIRRYHVRVTDCYAASGHAAGGEHPLGLGTDLVPGDGGSWDDVDRLARDAGWSRACGSSAVRPACDLKPWVRFVGYDGYANHGRGNHLHVSWEHGPGRPAQSVTVFSGGAS